MAKQFDLSGLRKTPVKKTPQPKIDKVVEAIHKEEEKAIKRAEKNIEIEEEEEDREPLKRVTLDLPASLHTRLKLRAVHDETTIRNFVIELLEDALD